MKRGIIIGLMVLFSTLPASTEAYFGGLVDFVGGVKPTCHVYTNPEISNAATEVELHWTSSNATWAVLDTVGTIPVNGTRFIGNVGKTTSYSITVGNAFGETTCSATVHVAEVVDAKPDNRDPACTLSVYPDNYIVGSTERVVLQWDVDNGEFAFINNGIGYVREAKGSLYVSPSETTTYTMKVTKPGADLGYCATTVTVSGNTTSGEYAGTQPYYTTPTTQTITPPSGYVPLTYIPYTGAGDTAYAFLMFFVALVSFGLVYRYGRMLLQ